jgi:Arc/MetJ-type ribon-helix-helix transcriptional regulator
MTADESDTDDDENESDFVRPGLTLKKRHDDLLDELQAARYGSRSEATRAAIESLAKSVLNDSETGIEQISKQVNQLEAQMKEIADQIDEIRNQLPADTANPPSQLGDATGPNQDVATVSSAETEGSADLQHAIYDILSEHGQLSVPEIAESIDEDPFDIHAGVEQLVEEYGFVTCIEESGAPQYRIKKSDSD